MVRTTFASNLENVEDEVHVWFVFMVNVHMGGGHVFLGHLQHYTKTFNTASCST